MLETEYHFYRVYQVFLISICWKVIYPLDSTINFWHKKILFTFFFLSERLRTHKAVGKLSFGPDQVSYLY